MDASHIRLLIGHFRILIIGRANAGKTTLLQRVCNTRNDPEIFNRAGEKIDATVLKASRERGEHDIENEMLFLSNPRYIFHDSRGFEAGGISEYDKVNAFIADRSKKKDIKDRIHIIWYCIPMDEASRAFTQCEVKFFSQCDTGSIPVIVVFTKFDALYDVEFARLLREGISRTNANALAPKHAQDRFTDGPQLRYLYHSKDIRRPPKCHVCLPDMDKDDADCGLLIQLTAETLNSEALQELLVSTQQTNLEVCMKYAVEKTLARLVVSDKKMLYEDAITRLGYWFPHVLAHDDVVVAIWARDDFDLRDAWVWARAGGARGLDINDYEHLSHDQCEEMQARILSVARSGSSPLETTVQLSSAAIIIFDHSFFIFNQRRTLPDKKKSASSFDVALEAYMASPHAAAVAEAVSTAVAEAVGTASAVHANQGNSSNWKAKLSFGHIWKKENREKVDLITRIYKIVLEHRLSRPLIPSSASPVDDVRS